LIFILILFQNLYKNFVLISKNYRCFLESSKTETLHPHPVLLSKPFLGLETKTETWDFRSRDRDLDKMNSSLETMVLRSQD